VHTSNSEVG